MARRSRIALVALCAMLLVACMAPQRSFVRDVDAKGWSSTVDIPFENEDTVSLRRLSVVVRYNSSFKADSLPVIVRVTAPDERYCEERVVLRFARPYTATAVSASESVPYREHSRLPMEGRYTFRIVPEAMTLGVEAVGIEIEKE